MESTESAPDAPQSQKNQPQSNRSTPTEAVSPNPTPDTSWAPDHGRRVTLEEYWGKVV